MFKSLEVTSWASLTDIRGLCGECWVNCWEKQNKMVGRYFPTSTIMWKVNLPVVCMVDWRQGEIEMRMKQANPNLLCLTMIWKCSKSLSVMESAGLGGSGLPKSPRQTEPGPPWGGTAGQILYSCSFPQRYSYERVLVSWEVEGNSTRRSVHFYSLIILNFQVNISSLTLNLPFRRSGTLFSQEQCLIEKAPIRAMHFDDKEMSLPSPLGKCFYCLKIHTHRKSHWWKLICRKNSVLVSAGLNIIPSQSKIIVGLTMNNFQVYFQNVFVFSSTLGFNVMKDDCCVFKIFITSANKGNEDYMSDWTVFLCAGTRWRHVAGS